MNPLSQVIRKFNRFELKYLISSRQAEIFKKDLRAYLTPDNNGGRDGTYHLSSLYYDSPDYRCYWEKIDGIRFRRKLRIRSYDTSQPLNDDSLVFVEIKQRLDRVTQKRRVILPYHNALLLCNQRQPPSMVSTQDAVIINEINAFLHQYNLRPASQVCYTRQAFMGSDYDIGLRVTFDTRLSCQPNSSNLHEQRDELILFPPEYVVMEIKVNERIPYWLTGMVAEHNFKLVRISKYCRSIEVGQNISSAHWQLQPVL